MKNILIRLLFIPIFIIAGCWWFLWYGMCLLELAIMCPLWWILTGKDYIDYWCSKYPYDHETVSLCNHIAEVSWGIIRDCYKISQDETEAKFILHDIRISDVEKMIICKLFKNKKYEID